ncbi:uncharacterized protein [Solanum tuberosum]|uniref:uncharacterized protein n=1 Tax=Solanum tuberosum TaxID=4113 RepID=UPI00073A0A2F|nr:PREDICTED: uncharacterized protein LOC107061540 [Solanum tuberosum]
MGEICLPQADGNVMFEVTSATLQFIHSRGLFGGLEHEDPHEHVQSFVEVCTPLSFKNLSQKSIRFCLFPLSLTGGATKWLVERPNNSIKSWEELVMTFHERFFPSSRMMKLRDDIQNFKQKEGEPIHESWTRFKKSLRKCPTHRLPGELLLQYFYRSLDLVNKGIPDQLDDQGDQEEDHTHLSESPKSKRSASSPRVNDLLLRILDKVEGSDDLLKGMKDDFSSLNSKVNSHVDVIKMLEGKLSLLSAQLTSKTPMDYIERDLVVVTRSGKVAIGEIMEDEDPQKHEESQGVEEQHFPIRQNLTKEPQEETEQQVQVPKVMHPLLKIPPPFPQQALLEMPEYAKFMKELVTKKRSLDYETIEVPHSCSAIMTNDSFTKREDPGAFTMPCTIGMFQFAKALCDLGASINLMPYAIYKQLDCEFDAEIPIILGRPFLATWRELVYVESRKLKFRVNDDDVTFNICKSMKQPSNIHVVSIEDVIDEAVESVSHLMRKNEPFESVLANYDESEVQGYKDVVAALSGLRAYSRNPIKFDIDLKNRESPPAKPSTEEPPNLELKSLPSHLKYAFLGANDTLPVIIVTDLLERQVKLLIEVLQKHIKAIR